MVKRTDQRIVKNLPDATIPYNTNFVGDIGTMGGIRVDGNVKGKVNAGGNLTVGVDGSVEGTVSANDVNIAGEIIGDVTAIGTVQMLSGARLIGDLCATSFAIEQGAYFKGQCLISDSKEPALINAPQEEKMLEEKNPEEKKSKRPRKTEKAE